MAIDLTLSPAQILQQLLINLGLGTMPVVPQPKTSWPIYYSIEPAEPDNVVTLFDTVGRSNGRFQVDGTLYQHYGFQVRVRSGTYSQGWMQVETIRVTMAKSVKYTEVVIGSGNFVVGVISDIGQSIALGTQAPNSKRYLFTLNAMATLTQFS